MWILLWKHEKPFSWYKFNSIWLNLNYGSLNKDDLHLCQSYHIDVLVNRWLGYDGCFPNPTHYPCTFSMTRPSLLCQEAPEMSRSRRSHGVCLAPMTFKPKDSHMLWWRWGSKKSKPWKTETSNFLKTNVYWFRYKNLYGISYACLTSTCQRVALQFRGHSLSGSHSLYSFPTQAVKFLPHSHLGCKVHSPYISCSKFNFNDLDFQVLEVFENLWYPTS